jgi:DNA-binding transcriptional regulator PaaX
MAPKYYKGVKLSKTSLPKISGKKIKRLKTKNRKRNFYLQSFSREVKKNESKNLLIIYDIPEALKKERDWFRRQLKNFGFIMIQKSVWVGPSPLPKDFLEYVEKIGLKKDFKTFKLAKSYKEKN